MDYYSVESRSRSESHSDLYAQWDAFRQTPLDEDAPHIVGVDKQEQEQCRLCLEPPTEPCCLARCGHVYCSTCIRQWLDFSPKCYTCKTSATTSNVMPLAPTRKRNPASGFGFADYFPFRGSDTASMVRNRRVLSPFSSSSSYCESSPGTLSTASTSSRRQHISLPPTRSQPQQQRRPSFPELLSPPETTMSSPSSLPSEILLPAPRIVFYKDDREAAAASTSTSAKRVVIRPERGGSHVYYDDEDEDATGADDEHDEDDRGWDTDEELDLQLNQLAVWQERSRELSSSKQHQHDPSRTASDPDEQDRLYPVQSRVLSVMGLALMLAVLLK